MKIPSRNESYTHLLSQAEVGEDLGVGVIVAAETAGEIGVAEVVRVSAPSHLHLGEDVALVDGQDGARGLRDLEATLQALYVYEGFGSNQFITGFRLVLSEMPQNETAPVRRIALSAGQCHPKPE